MIDYDKINSLKTNLKAQIGHHAKDVLNLYPVETYMAIMNKFPTYCGYKYIGTELEAYCSRIVRQSSLQLLELYHKLLLVTYISSAESKVMAKKLPTDIKQYYFKDFSRILSQIENDPEASGTYLYPNDDFFKDRAICSLRMFPIGGRKYLFTKFPVQQVIFNGWRSFAKVMFFILFEARGREPFLTGHWDTHDPNFKAEFTVEGMIYAHRMLAEVMKMNPEIRGTYGIGWTGDPIIERISPRLAYLRYFSQMIGTTRLYYGTSETTIKNATLKSRTRRRLYEEGRYLPADWISFRSRRRLIKWADQYEWYW